MHLGDDRTSFIGRRMKRRGTDSFKGQNTKKGDVPTASAIAPGRAAGGESREGSDGGDGGDDGGRQELLSYVRGRHGSLASHGGVTISLIIHYSYYLLFYFI